jgi:hypothetical protein
MKTLNFKWQSIILASLVLIAGCNKEDAKDVSDFVGNYVISKAELEEELTVPTEEAGNVSVPVGTDITQAIQTALLSAVNCSSPDKSYVELREDNSLYLSSLNAGTWEELSATSLKLNMNSTAIPPAGFVLTVTDIVKDASGLSGITSVPLSKEMVSDIITPLQLTLSASAPNVFIVEISIEFMEK